MWVLAWSKVCRDIFCKVIHHSCKCVTYKNEDCDLYLWNQRSGLLIQWSLRIKRHQKQSKVKNNFLTTFLCEMVLVKSWHTVDVSFRSSSRYMYPCCSWRMRATVTLVHQEPWSCNTLDHTKPSTSSAWKHPPAPFLTSLSLGVSLVCDPPGD